MCIGIVIFMADPLDRCVTIIQGRIVSESGRIIN